MKYKTLVKELYDRYLSIRDNPMFSLKATVFEKMTTISLTVALIDLQATYILGVQITKIHVLKTKISFSYTCFYATSPKYEGNCSTKYLKIKLYLLLN